MHVWEFMLAVYVFVLARFSDRGIRFVGAEYEDPGGLYSNCNTSYLVETLLRRGGYVRTEVKKRKDKGI